MAVLSVLGQGAIDSIVHENNPIQRYLIKGRLNKMIEGNSVGLRKRELDSTCTSKMVTSEIIFDFLSSSSSPTIV